jgi:hypothetical protein
MSTVRRPPTTTIVDGWPLKVPSGAPHLNVDDDVASPNLTDFVQAGDGDKVNEYGGFFVPSDIPEGATINSISVRQHMRGAATPDNPGVRFALKVAGAERAVSSFSVDTEGEDETNAATFLASGITRDELVGGTFTVEKKTTSGASDPPLPGG